MNDANQLTNETLPGEIYQRCLWALTVFGAVIIFFFLTWLSIQRAEIWIARRQTREAELRTADAHRELDVARRDSAEAARILNERLAKAEAARIEVENGMRDMPTHAVNPTALPLAQVPAQTLGRSQTGTPAMAVELLTNFVKTHLARMTESVEAQLPDYAGDVEFHDKPHATASMIEKDRRMWAQKYPVRVIFKDEIQPQFEAVHDPVYGVSIKATFDWRWEFKTRSGSIVRGTTRDTWKIIPTNIGFRIVAEHSADPVTNASRD